MSVVETTEASHPAVHLTFAIPSEPRRDHTAQFTTRWMGPSVAVITAHGEVDACNAGGLADYALRYAPHCTRLILDLSGVDFFGTEGFVALNTVDGGCARAAVEWAVVPSAAVTRLLRVCDPEGDLPTGGGVDAALASLQDEPRPLLKLVSKSR